MLALLQHVERQGFPGAPRALGFDERGRENLTYVDGSVGADLPDADAGALRDVDHWIWRDDVLVHLAGLVREYHDAAATFPYAGREWQLEVRRPVETICHNDLAPSNVVFRAGIPVALIDWEAAAPGPRAWDLGFAAWRWIPFWPDAKCRAAGLPTGTTDKARRLRVLLDAYGIEPDVAFMRTAMDRMQSFMNHLSELAAAGSVWEVQLARRGVLDDLKDQSNWVDRHAAQLLAS